MNDKSINHWRLSGEILLTGLIGFILLIGMTWFYINITEIWKAPPLIFNSDNLAIINGQGIMNSDGLEIQAPGPDGIAIIQASLHAFSATSYQNFSWQINGLRAEQTIHLIWATSTNQNLVHSKTLLFTNPPNGSVNLTTIPDWQGQIVALGLAITNPQKNPFIINYLKITSYSTTIQQIFKNIWEIWCFHEDWTGHSINFNVSAPRDAIISPVLFSALWLGISSLVYLFLIRPFWRKQSQPSFLPYFILILIAWFALDLRWQWELLLRLNQTFTSAFDLTTSNRPINKLNNSLNNSIDKIRSYLSSSTKRIFLLSAEPQSYQIERARYLLAPYNTSLGLRTLPAHNILNSNDILLILAPFPSINYNQQHAVLQNNSTHIPVNLIYSEPQHMMLFQVRAQK